MRNAGFSRREGTLLWALFALAMHLDKQVRPANRRCLPPFFKLTL